METDSIAINVLVTPTEAEQLQVIAAKFGQTPEELLTGFIADLTGSDRSNGDQEHEAAKRWWDTILANWR